ncbi:hypothetical protein [Dethiobacter alkaliphilus]|uniref:hypothetical protein n=1 Tax=Dethiobacter alkaliphilus TaxID=427926 RepID=UPI002226A3A3|nr:hypothetical protein [Dethiobacter alkaliphilus]MCW3491695.1 hypothetical protein [Dethiobacter alkaliphilus]
MMIYILIALAVLWYLRFRYQNKDFIPTFNEMLIFSILLITWGVLSALDEAWGEYIINPAFIFAVFVAIDKVIKKSNATSLKEAIKELFAEQYGFRGFVYLLACGFVFLIITAALYSLTEIPLFVYVFGGTGIAAITIGCLGMIYGFIRFYTPLLFDVFKKSDDKLKYTLVSANRKEVSMKKKTKTIFLIPTSVVVIGLLALWLTGMFGFWSDGMAFLANNTRNFTDGNGYIIEGQYQISIDLSDLDSNIGQELYNDGTHRIYVKSVYNTGSSNTGGYIISFRSSGQYSLTQASLISGIQHATVSENSFTKNMSAQMTAEYNGKIYDSWKSGVSGLNYKDGDNFSFYIFPGEAYDSNEVSLNEDGIVHLTVTNLYKNIWTKL